MKYIIAILLVIILLAVVINLIEKFWVFIVIAAFIAVFAVIARKVLKTGNQESEDEYYEDDEDDKDGTSRSAVAIKNTIKKTIEFNVAGVSYRTDNIISLGEQNPDFELTKKQMFDLHADDTREFEYIFDEKTASFIFEPDNKYDPNAIRIEIDGLHVGYVPRGMCREMKQAIDSDRITEATARISGGRYRYLDFGECDELEPKSSDCKLRTSRINLYIEIHVEMS